MYRNIDTTYIIHKVSKRIFFYVYNICSVKPDLRVFPQIWAFLTHVSLILTETTGNCAVQTRYYVPAPTGAIGF
jgi:hypothetical protein